MKQNCEEDFAEEHGRLEAGVTLPYLCLRCHRWKTTFGGFQRDATINGTRRQQQEEEEEDGKMEDGRWKHGT